MIKQTLPTDETIATLLGRLMGRVASTWEVEEFFKHIASHDLLDPIAYSKVEIGTEDLTLSGNRVTSGRNPNSFIYIDSRGHLQEHRQGETARWIKAFEALGWQAEEGIVGMFDKRLPEARHVAMRRLTMFDRSKAPQPILMSFSCISPEGNCGNLSLRTVSFCEGTLGAERLIEAVHHARRIMPGGPERAIRKTTEILEAIVKEEIRGGNEDLEYKVTVPSWHNAVVIVQGVNAMLEPSEDACSVQMRQCPVTGISADPNDIERLKAMIRRNMMRKERQAKGGVITTGLAHKILGPRRPDRLRKWQTVTNGAVRTKSRVTIKDGTIGGEVIIEKNGKRVLRLLNSSFELPGTSLPESTATALVGRRLSDLVKHPMITPDMVITKINTSDRRTTGRYQDNGRTQA